MVYAGCSEKMVLSNNIPRRRMNGGYIEILVKEGSTMASHFWLRCCAILEKARTVMIFCLINLFDIYLLWPTSLSTCVLTIFIYIFYESLRANQTASFFAWSTNHRSGGLVYILIRILRGNLVPNKNQNKNKNQNRNSQISWGVWLTIEIKMKILILERE